MSTLKKALPYIALMSGLLTNMLSINVQAAGNPRHGEDVFAAECAECHSVREGKNKKGASLFAVVGRNAATVPDASYSDALSASNIVWTVEQLDSYISAPKKAVPNGKMKYDGLESAADRADLLAYLATVH